MPIRTETPKDFGGQGATPAPSQKLQGFADMFNAVNAPQQALDQQQIDSLRGQYGAGLAQSQLSGQQAQQQFGFDTQRLGLQSSELQRQQSLQPQLFGLTMQDIAAQRESLQRGAKEDLQSFLSGQGAKGALGTMATPQGQSDIAFQLSQGLGKLGREEKRAGLQQKETMAQLGDTAKGLGISSQELKSRLDNTMAQLGITDAAATDQLFGEIAKIQAGEYSPIAGFIGNIFNMAQLGNPFSGGQGGIQ